MSVAHLHPSVVYKKKTRMRSNDINILSFIFFLAQSYVGGVEEEEGGTPGQTRLSVATLLNRHE